MRHRLKKRLGQHHLLSGRLCRPLIDFLEPGGRRVVEIGPGGGVLTRELQRAGGRVIAWEVDPEWAFALRRDPGRPALVIGDALAIPWDRLPAGSLVAGNLPYNIGTALIESLLRSTDVVPRAAFLVQLEVAERLTASPGSGAYGALTLIAAARADVLLLGRVARGSFRPPPKVDGAFVGLRLERPVMSRAELETFAPLVRSAFAHRRKTLLNSLAAAWGRAAAATALGAAGLDGRRRAEELDGAEFRALWRHRPAAGC